MDATRPCTTLEVAFASFLSAVLNRAKSWLSLSSWPSPDSSLVSLLVASSYMTQCAAVGNLFKTWLDAYTTLVTAFPDWNVTQLHSATAPDAGERFSEIINAYNVYLEYHSAKSDLLSKKSGRLYWLGDGFSDRAESIMGSLLRISWLSLAVDQGNWAPYPGHCACRYAPETQSILFDLFEALRDQSDGTDFDYSPFMCDSLDNEPDASQLHTVFSYARYPSFMQCIPADIIIRAACAQQAVSLHRSRQAKRLMDAVVNLMALASDCFDHTPWTSGDMGAVSAAEVWHNWARFEAGDLRHWQKYHPDHIATASRSQARSFEREGCTADLGPARVDLLTGQTTIFDMSQPAGKNSRQQQSAFLYQCGDSYGDWRPVSVQPARTKHQDVSTWRPAWLLYVSPLATENLWHLLHILIPAFVRANEEDWQQQGGDIVIDGLSDRLSTPDDNGGTWSLQASLCWRLIALLGKRLPFIIGRPFSLGHSRRFETWSRLLWGHAAIALFGRDKGSLTQTQIRGSLHSMLHITETLPGKFPDGFFHDNLKQDSLLQSWRVLFVSRPPESRRGLMNKREVVALLNTLAHEGRLRLAWTDFGREPLAGNAAAQMRLAQKTDVFVGPHGAGLAWAAFMEEGRILLEVMPHMRALQSQLCKSFNWQSTPMYAYGGLSQLAGIRHRCLIGSAPALVKPSDNYWLTLFDEVGRWSAAPVHVNLDQLSIALRESFALLDADYSAGRVCPLRAPDRFLCEPH